MDFVNLVGVIPGRDRSLPPMLIGAHYDSVIPSPCADDNGAAVAICFAVAEAASRARRWERDLIIAIFDAEEPPFFHSPAMGSIRFYEDQLDDRGVHFALIQDLVGHDVSIPLPGMGGRDLSIPGICDALFVTGVESCPELSGVMGKAGIPGRLKVVATLNQYVGDMSDHGIFRRNDVPYLFLSCGRWAHYHQPTDTPDRLNYRKMARIADLAWRIIGQVDTEKLERRSHGDHTLDYEISTLQGLAGPLLPVLLKMAGITKLKTRAEIDQLVGKLSSFGLC